MHAHRVTAAQVAPHLGAVLGRKANPQATLDMAKLTNGNCYIVRDDAGQEIGAYVLRGEGSEVWIQAAAGAACVDLCDLFDWMVQQHGQGFDSIGFRTYRRGLVRKAQARGYRIADTSDGFILRKTLQ